MMPDREELLIGEFPFVPKQERAQQKRNALLDSGHALFTTKGYEQTTAKEIAAQAGVATGTFYRYFSDKRQLLMSLLEEHIEGFMPPEPKWVTSDPEQILASLLEEHDKKLNQLGLQKVLPELLPKDSELAEVLADARRKLHVRICSKLKSAYEEGYTWKDLDLDTVTWAIMTLSEKAVEKETQCKTRTDYFELSKVICRMVFPPEVISRLQQGNEESE
jgi:TetR/AcrR family transcriptional regulator, mexJK operon transcriptional repressor